MNFDNPEINKYRKEIYNSNIDELSSHLIAEYTIDLDMVLEFELNGDNEEIYFMLTGESIVIDYEDGKSEKYDETKETIVEHKYKKKGNYIVRIKGKLIKFNWCSSNIKKVINWNYYLENLRYAFNNCKKLEDVPKYISVNVQNMAGMFYSCSNFNSDISKWNVSNVQNMSRMFEGCYNFNSDISKWNVSNVRNMFCMFESCYNFNSDISEWNVSNVRNMAEMFYNCYKFNSDISKWNVSNVQNMSRMFSSCGKFNSDISKWDVSSVQIMNCMFYDCNILEKYRPTFN